MTKITADQIRAYRDVNECGFDEAKRVLIKEARLDELKALRSRAGELYTVEGAGSVLSSLIDLMIEETKR